MRFGMIAAAAAALVCAGQADAANWLRYDLGGTAVVTGYNVPQNGVYIPILPTSADVFFSFFFDADMFPVSSGKYVVGGGTDGSISVTDTATGLTAGGSIGDGRTGFTSFGLTLNLPSPDGSFPTAVTGPVSGTLSVSTRPYAGFLPRTELNYTLNVNSVRISQTAPLTFFSAPFQFTAVPEPATWAMLILGVAAIGYTMRRRQLAYFAHG